MLILLRIEDVLADLGCKSVRAASSVEEALDLIGAEAFDAAMLDLNLDGKMSYEIADALAARGVPFLFSTGYDADSLEDGYRDQPVLGKPYCDDELVVMLSSLVSRADLVAPMSAGC